MCITFPASITTTNWYKYFSLVFCAGGTLNPKVGNFTLEPVLRIRIWPCNYRLQKERKKSFINFTIKSLYSSQFYKKYNSGNTNVAHVSIWDLHSLEKMWKNTYCKNLNVYKKPVLDPVKNDSESQHCFELVSIDRSETEKINYAYFRDTQKNHARYPLL